MDEQTRRLEVIDSGLERVEKKLDRLQIDLRSAAIFFAAFSRKNRVGNKLPTLREGGGLRPGVFLIGLSARCARSR
ncbi:MAG: hypothetical protein ACYTEL_18775 [Planctomycetota bacterium]|jgi:hypothetical protein